MISIFGCLAVSSLSILMYDYFLTLSDEIAHVWTSRLSFGLPLFYINRYLPFGSHFAMVYMSVTPGTADACGHLYRMMLWITVIASNTAHTIIYLQTCAIWGNKRLIVYPLLFLLLAKVLISVIFAASQLKDAKFYSSFEIKKPDPLRGCFISTSKNLSQYVFIVVFVSVFITITVTCIRAGQHLRRSDASWVSQLYRNGILYCFVILLFSLGNVIVPNLLRLVRCPV
ncbi:hypothetical protein FA15DRAFT_361953 [Coprinopsis marcescibilis]|uniref:DUF6533 domain-containing protein n=1 Tax=Coprinopsis marcescibilis TaxID=230819 RepID=A0A5C3KY98_COPMA|nr:hypothetical protein FA15DRAFT_361953 [Coprinopsis marcescibilis]